MRKNDVKQKKNVLPSFLVVAHTSNMAMYHKYGQNNNNNNAADNENTKDFRAGYLRI